MQTMKTNDAASILIKAFCDGVAPPKPIEEIRIACEQALHDLDDDSRPERDRINSTVRLIASVPFITDRLSRDALNEIYGRQGVVPAE